MAHRGRFSQVLIAVSLLVPAVAPADGVFAAQWQRLRAQQPKGVQLVISAPKATFYLGETIPLELTFTSTQAQSFLADTRQYDRVGRMNYVEQFLVDPASSTEDPLRGLPGENGGMGGLSGGPLILSERPFRFERILNEWLRFRKPGRYRVYVVSHRVTKVSETERSDNSQRMYAGRTRVDLASNMLTIQIQPAPASWVKDQIAAATRILDAPGANSNEVSKERTRAGQILRFLDTPQAAVELAKHLGAGLDVDSYSLHMGVLGSSYRKQLLPLLEQRLVAPEQPVWERYLDTLARLSQLVASGGPMPPQPKDEQQRKTWMEESQRRAELLERKRNEYAGRLFASLGSKQPQARAISLQALLDSAGRTGSGPPWLPDLVQSVIRDFRSLPVTTERDLLESRWNLVKSPALVPALRELYAKPPAPRVDPSTEDVALRRLFELAPEEARQDVLEEIRHPAKNLGWAVLAMLPDPALPELNDTLGARAEAHDLDERLILRYATGDIVGRVERAYLERNAELDRQNLPHCSSPLVFYFLRYDPEFGGRELRRNLSTPGGPPVCYDIGFQFVELGRYAMSPALERLGIELLPSPSAPIKRGAAEVLGKYGSVAAEEPLWRTMEYFRSWWKEREDQLNQPIGQEWVQLEWALRNALAKADGWVLQEADLHRLLDLCSGEWCKQDLTEWLRVAAAPIAIAIMPGPDAFHVSVAQYDGVPEEQLRRKLSQYPPGTAFRIVPFASEDRYPGLKPARERVEQAVRATGHRLAP